MQLSTSYRQILNISVPIMLGSAAQNIIVLCDNLFLFNKDVESFGAIGMVGLFYLIIASIGYGFSRGGQIIIARRYGEKDDDGLVKSFHTLIGFEFLLALVLFLILQFGSPYIFSFFIESEVYYQKALEYIYPRSYGIFFSYVGVSIIAFYTGIAYTRFILIDTVILIITNIILNYIFIFGHFGFPAMDIAGAAWASTLSEVAAFIVFVIYMKRSKLVRRLKIFSLPRIDKRIVRSMYEVSFPIVVQSFAGIGSWFLFFSLIENYLGTEAIKTSNLVRIVYLILSIPCWGFSAGINTLVSNFIGAEKRQAVEPIIKKTAGLNLAITMLVSIPVLIFPDFFLYPFFGSEDMMIIHNATPSLLMLLPILTVFCIGSIYMNGVMGTGSTTKIMNLQIIATVFYLLYAWVAIIILEVPLHIAWASEVFYWTILLAVSWYLLRRKDWYQINV